MTLAIKDGDNADAAFKTRVDTGEHVQEVDANQGAPAASLADAWPMKVTDGTNVLGSTAHPVVVEVTDGTNVLGTIAHPVVTQGPGASGAALSGNPTLVAGSDGTNAVNQKVDSSGNLYTRRMLPTLKCLQTASADTAKHQLAAQAVKTPVTIKAGPSMVGTVTIGSATADGPVLKAGEQITLECGNLSEIGYTFSVGTGGVENFGLFCGI